MSRHLPTPPPSSRYSYRRAAAEIEARIDILKNVDTQKAVAAYAGLDESAFSHRLTGAKSRFTIEHIGAIADYLKAPPGWPFIPWQEAWERDELWTKRKRRGKP